MTDQTFHVTREDIRKLEARESRRYHGQIPADADSSILKSIVDQNKNRSKDPQANLELPDDPPVPGDMKSADARYSGGGIGSGRFSGDLSTEKDGLREPAAQQSGVRVDGEKLHKGTILEPKYS
ncbi:uncharacterized protein H6S33_011629 [Morchella sextelata]|uniref:uncharacterized protein n=1 Tax=Morchella sextelata TaxID=1174677 RepID=UPI001D04F2EF|nr:uncharacterized protein H6S33_011629 [Morchella sextelata]KAH0611202.1 hypothetical protein H6S33_011629 [Morchella sextelata]